LRRGLIYLLYWTLQAAAFPLLLLYLAFRAAKNKNYARRLGERFGMLPPTIEATLPGGIWLHAVSVGEVLSSIGLLRRIRAELPGVPVWVSTATLAGRDLADSKLGELADGIFYAPFDYRFAIRRVLRRVRPAVVVVMETEIWPNLYRDTRLAGARLLVVNGRISDKAWPSYQRWGWFFAAALSYVDRVLAQGPQAAERYRALGAADVIEAGNLKYDFDPDATRIAEPLREWLQQTQPRQVWIAASTMPGEPDEDDLVIEAVQKLGRPGLLTILVPRKPERFDEAAAKLKAAGVRFVRRSALESLSLPGVLLLDSMGELAGLFRAADVVFMGGTFPQRGGHNILEPAAFGKPVVIGPHMENFPEIAAEFRRERAVVETADLAGAVGRLLDDPGDCGVKGARLAARNRGATTAALDEIRRQIPLALLHPPQPWWRMALLGPLTLLWRGGLFLDRLRTRPRRLSKPVISIGNLSAGGTGKTPFTLWLAGELRARGYRPAVLTRGYKSGEEARLYERAGIPVGIGRDRVAAAQALDADVFLLDDGFQHWALHRDIDIVLVDALDPLAGGLLPLGRSREPWNALSRATVVVSTRGALPGIRFAAHVEAAGFEAPRGRIGAFCGLGNPASFRRTLGQLGVRVEFFEVFPDHHRYTPEQVERMAGRADMLLTTEKDWLNLPDPSRATPVRIRLRIENSDELLKMLEARLPTPATGA
jgi:3-deoxy-D-manno-octulosonic-acid transferase